MTQASWYNGYTPQERDFKYDVLLERIQSGALRNACGPCMLCGDAEVDVVYHDEDYSQPFLWEPPALFTLCRNCHLSKLHKRFSNPYLWHAFVAHVRRGGYERDLRDPSIQAEVQAAKVTIKRGETPTLRPLRPYAKVVGQEWFANLRMDRESLTDPAARPRP